MGFKKVLKPRVIAWFATTVVLVATFSVANFFAQKMYGSLLDRVFGGKRAITVERDKTAPGYLTKEQAYNNGNAVTQEICEEGMILLKNEGNALPLKANAKVSVFGKNSTNFERTVDGKKKTIGLVYGAVSGYFGGKVDLIMERITDIIANVPTIIIMTIMQIQLTNNDQLKAAIGSAGTIILAILIAFVYNGWVGVASTTRMQFYRFKGQEYVLASRTLGARDSRLIFKHILPNAAGTLVTSSVLMIPGVIFSESSLSYLGIINFSTSGISSIGALLNEGQAASIQYYPHVLLFPAIVISLLMISFNLFGNGLRDAFNTTLRGSEE